MSALTVEWMPYASDAQFDRAAPLLERVVQKAVKGEFTVEDLRRLAASGRVLIGVASRDGKDIMASAMEVVRYPQFNALNIMAMGGAGLEDVANVFFEDVKRMARAFDCKQIEASGSRAMARLLRACFGFEPLYEKVGYAL